MLGHLPYSKYKHAEFIKQNDLDEAIWFFNKESMQFNWEKR